MVLRFDTFHRNRTPISQIFFPPFTATTAENNLEVRLDIQIFIQLSLQRLSWIPYWRQHFPPFSWQVIIYLLFVIFYSQRKTNASSQAIENKHKAMRIWYRTGTCVLAQEVLEIGRLVQKSREGSSCLGCECTPCLFPGAIPSDPIEYFIP